ncbi:MAG TPA: long-chain fatty acid--CoA ligase [Thermomicrobiales bacterium]|nr:long-chain fatty acid--CoA ligase [Thermomicrobiales bacterium]
MSEQQAASMSGAASVYDSKPWLRHYQTGVPASIDYPQWTVPDLFASAVSRFPDRDAVIFYGNGITYRELDRLSSQFANRMIELGLKPGEPVLLILANLPQFPIAHLGILKAGGIVAALNPLLVEREIAELAKDSGARFVVVLDRMWDRVEPIVERGELDGAIVTGVQDYLPGIKRLLYPLKFRKEIVKVAHQPAKGIYQFRKLMTGAPERSPTVNRGSRDVALFQYTGGTTGLPKAAMLTHANVIANTFQGRAWIPDMQDGQETILAVLPFFHAYGGTLCLHLGFHLGATIVLVPRFDLADVMTLIQKHQPTIVPGVPTLYHALNSGARSNPDRQQALKSIRWCISGGAPLPEEVQTRFEELTGGRLVEGYGLSEASPVTHGNPLDGRSRIGSMGLPIPDTEARIVDIDTREVLPQGERGELVVRGPQVMRGYWNREQDTAAVLSDDGWLYTGDIATMDEDGFFRIVDRQKDVIITGGENVYPREIEEVLFEHPKISEVAVAAVDHPVGGQVAKAYIVVKEGETLDRREVLHFCSDKLAKFKIPRLIEFRDSLPKSPAGKVLRRELQEGEEKKSRAQRAGDELADVQDLAPTTTDTTNGNPAR